MEPTKKAKGVLVPVCDQYSVLKMSVPAEFLPTESTQQTCAIMCIDISGSMAGSALSQAKEALLESVKLMQANNAPVVILAFDSAVSIQSSEESDHAAVNNFIKKLDARGGTQFRHVFDSLLTRIQLNPTRNYFIAFFTDGCDNDSYGTLEPHMLAFKNYVSANAVTVAIHTVGFTSSHDATLLNKIISFGTKDGTFQYVTDSKAIPQAIGNLTKLIDFSNFWGELQIAGNIPIRLNFQKDEEVKAYSANMFVDDSEIKATAPISYAILVHKGKDVYKIPVDVEMGKEPGDLLPRIENFIELVRTKLILAINRMTLQKSSNEVLMKQKEEIDKLRAQLSQYMTQTMKSRDANKMQVVEKLKECREIFTEYFVAYNEAMTKGIVSNLSLAKLNNLAYKGVFDSKVAREMAKRASAGQKFMEKMVLEVECIKKSLNYEELAKKYKDTIEDFGHCAITYQTWLEALQEGDCLCLTYDAERNLDDIFDSSTVRIKSINVSMLTSEAFVSAAVFASDSQHGVKLAEFGPMQNPNSMAKVLPNEIVNGILPIYICEEHWRIASLKMRPMNAWTDTHDILAIAKHHPIRIPFLVLIKALDTATTEHKKRQFKWVLDTCDALYQVPEHKELIMADFKEVFAKYIECPQFRTTEFVKSIPIFFAHYCFAVVHGDTKVSDLDLLVKSVIEEVFRRETKDVTNDKGLAMKYLCDVLRIDYDTSIKSLANLALEKQSLAAKSDPAILFAQRVEQAGKEVEKQWVAGLEGYSKAKIDELTGKEEELTRSILATFYTAEVDAKIEEYRKKYEEMLKQSPDIASVTNLANVLLKKEYKFDSIKSLGIFTNEKLILLVLQNAIQASNAKRKVAVNAGFYLSPFAPQEEVVKQLTKMRQETIKLARDYVMSREIKGKPQADKTEKDAKAFVSTANAYTAGGILQGAAKSAEILLFLKAMADAKECPLLREKLAMILSGVYKDVVVIPDIDTITGGAKELVKQIVGKYFLTFNREEWFTIGEKQKPVLDAMFAKVRKNVVYGHPPLP